MKTVNKTNRRDLIISRTNFTASDLKNDLYKLAKQATKKTSDAKRTNASVGAYRAILATIKLEIAISKLGTNISDK